MLARLWLYQRERFPLAAHAPLVALFSWAALSYGALPAGPSPTFGRFLAAFLSALLCFLQLRVADEFKDYADDMRHRPYRPVPRGLVSLRELGAVALSAAAVQLVLALWAGAALLPALLLLWGWVALMSCEFFLGERLRARPIAYMVSHLLVVPLLAGYLSAFGWLAAGQAPPAALGWLLGASFFGGMIFELGRKIRAPQAEEPGVETYSALWGPRPAAAAWLAAVALGTAHTLFALWAGRAPAALSLLPLAALAVAGLAAQRYANSPSPAGARAVERASAIGVLGCYLAIGLIALLPGGAL